MLLLFTAACLYLLANARKLTDFDWSVQPGWVALAAVLVIVVAPVVRTWLWRTILARLGASISFAECFRIVRLSQLAKYLPGQVWHFVGTFYLANKAGATKGVAFSSMLYDNGASVVAGAVVVMLGTAFFTPLSGYTAIWVVAGANLIIGAILLYPRLFSAIAGVILRKLQRPPVPEPPSLWAGHIGGLFLVNVGFWVILGSSLFFLVRGVTSPGIDFSDAVVIGSIGVMAGFVAPFAPSGIGVTEGIMVMLLQRSFPVEVALAIALLFRVLNISKEILLGLVALKIERSMRPQYDPDTSALPMKLADRER